MPDRVAPNIEIDRIPKTKDLRFRKISEDQISLFMKNCRIPETEHLVARSHKERDTKTR